MKRDWNEFRNVLLKAEAFETYPVLFKPETPLELHHWMIAREAKFVDLNIVEAFEGPKILFKEVKYRGHDFLAKARITGLWEKAMKKQERMGAMTLGMLERFLGMRGSQMVTG